MFSQPVKGVSDGDLGIYRFRGNCGFYKQNDPEGGECWS